MAKGVMQAADAGPLIEQLSRLALVAGAEAMRLYAGEIVAAEKSDSSPVTEADKVCEDVILKGLAAIAPGVPVVAEESASEGRIPETGAEFFLVDPLDGTREFIDRTGDFTVNIALVRDRDPALGVVYAPAKALLYAGAPGLGAHRRTIGPRGGLGRPRIIAARKAPTEGLVAVASRAHRSKETDDFLATLSVADFAAAGSALKFCLVAEGSADVYPRLSRTMEWDTAAGQAVLEAAGGRVEVHPEGVPLTYGKAERGFDNPGFIAWGAA